MYKIFLSVITILCIITGGHLMSIPVFGTKRYHRTPSIAGSSLTSSNIPYYNNQLSTYYDNQPISSPSSSSSALSTTYGGSSIPISNLNSINNNYQNGYLTENGYYYYPRHEYHSYGMPTYHGEYKPTPYYYAPAPHYSYYDDRDIISNPMDDLHEEILHEDERERQRELQPPPYGEENWYQTHNNHQQQQQDDLTNNFLKNLIEYNRQIDAQQKLQQQQQDELMQRDQEHKLQLQYQQQLQQEQQQQQQHQQQQQPFSDEYDEYVELGDYEYEPQASENIYDMKKYERLDNFQPNYQSGQQQNVYNPLQQQQQMKSVSKHFDKDDEDVRQLKSLAHHSNTQNIKISNTKSPKSHHKTAFKVKDNSAEDIDLDEFNNYSENNLNQQLSSHIQKEQPIPMKSYAQYDNEPEQYDDDAWISWDRKRSPDTAIKNIDKWKQSLKKIESIKAFNNRKPLIVKVNDFKEITTPKNQIETSTKITTATASSTVKNELSTIQPNTINEKLLTGQKEIVIPRPANNPQTNIFKGFNMFANPNIQSKQQQIDHLNLMKQPEENDVSDDKANIIIKKSLKDDQKRSSKENVYDTIKQLLTMEQQLEKTPISSKVQKRFVTNEESLVNELNNLKRNST